jgi:hypothetical protein
MTSKAPPIPPEQRSAPGDKPHLQDGSQANERRGKANLREQGRAGNIHQNTHHQGYQQDR